MSRRKVEKATRIVFCYRDYQKHHCTLESLNAHVFKAP